MQIAPCVTPIDPATVGPCAHPSHPLQPEPTARDLRKVTMREMLRLYRQREWGQDNYDFVEMTDRLLSYIVLLEETLDDRKM
jgi:hypothetical protein